MAGWTEKDIPSQTGRVAVVTGANSGIGYYEALQLAIHGARVVLASRDTAKAATAADAIHARAPEAQLEVAALDLASLASVRDFAKAYLAAHDGLDILINNAGVMAIPYRKTADGFEMQFGTNHLGHFALTGLLLPALLSRPAARVVTVSSNAAASGRIDFDDLQSERSYKPWRAYRQSKLANLLFMLELGRMVRARGLDLVSVAAHPGYAATNLQGVGPAMTGNKIQMRMMELANRFIAQPASLGALPELYAATMPGVRGGEYFGPDGFRHMRGYPILVAPPKQALDEETARRLWQISEQLTGVHYDQLETKTPAKHAS